MTTLFSTSTAQVRAPESAGDVPATTAESAKPARAETSSGELLMVEGYVFLWLALMGWLLFLWRKQARLHERLDGLEKAIGAAEAAQSAPREKGAGS